MGFIFIGHRGTGKSSLAEALGRHESSLSSHFVVLDLDRVIEDKTNALISELWKTRGESGFRELELQVFDEIIQEPFSILVLGAGFELEKRREILKEHEVVWIRRDSDRFGRIFENRPALSAGPPLEAYLSRFPEREKTYAQSSDWCLTLREGRLEPQLPFIQNLLQDRYQQTVRSGAAQTTTHTPHSAQSIDLSSSTVTVYPDRLEHPRYFERLKQWRVGYLELRTDLLKETQIEKVLKNEGCHFQILLSIRSAVSIEFLRSATLLHPNLQFDCDAQFLNQPHYWTDPLVTKKMGIVSLHQDFTSGVSQVIQELVQNLAPKFPLIIKCALRIQNIEQLIQFDQLKHSVPDTENYKFEFLPLSESGEMKWYRMHHPSSKPLQFLRLDEGSASDQPTLLEQLMSAGISPKQKPFFAAVLGDPVSQSRSPIEHYLQFAKRGWAFYAICVKESEWTQAIPWLLEKGLRAAAVTSPLKIQAGQLVQESALNTLAFVEHSQTEPLTTLGLNTDARALEELTDQLKGHSVLWGAGGLVQTISEIWPQVTGYSARTKSHRFGPMLEPHSVVDTLIWAVPRKRLAEGAHWPPHSWTPTQVFDLNYGDSSPGKEYALAIRANYISGLEFFNRQAHYQKEFWQKTLFSVGE